MVHLDIWLESLVATVFSKIFSDRQPLEIIKILKLFRDIQGASN
jgi:adenine-specific DNA methylase